jgi:hypothetical protein
VVKDVHDRVVILQQRVVLWHVPDRGYLLFHRIYT